MKLDRIYNEDCLEGMKRIPDGSVDCIICDLPYGTTQNKWDSVIPFEPLWEQYHRVCKPNAPIVLFSQQPFTSALVMSNPKMFRYEWIWEKDYGTGFLNAQKMPMKAHENLLVFYNKLPTYNPQMWKSTPYKKKRHPSAGTENYGKYKVESHDYDSDMRFPKDVVKFQKDDEFYNSNVKQWIHPTQKPVDLLRYLVLTYTNEGDTVLDNCMGSGTTAIACIKERRHFIGFELSKEYFDKAVRRIKAEQAQLTLF